MARRGARALTDRRGADEANRLAAESLAAGDATGWFERLYDAAGRGETGVPWARGAPHPLLVAWADERELDGRGKRALVVGAGLGDDAEFVAGRGFETVAFDVAPSAIRGAQRRFPESSVEYVVADLLDPPADWREAFDLVVESITVQALPKELQPDATRNVASFVAPGGTLLVISTALGDDGDPWDGPPWPLTRAEVEAFAGGGLQPVRIEPIRDPDVPPRWRAEFRR